MKIFFTLIFIISIICISTNREVIAQVKLNESFEGAQFPPSGWTVANVQGTIGVWTKSSRISKSGVACAVSNFTGQLTNNFLITKRFTPFQGDSLVFYFKQTFWNVYTDTLNVYISNTDSLPAHMSTRLLHMREGFNYPSPLAYGRFAINLSAYAGQTVWIGFQHLNNDGDNVRLDDISVGSLTSNDVGVLTNNFPSGLIGSCNYERIIPAATIKNFGNVSQSLPFNITYIISGLLNYSNTISDTIFSGHMKTIYFDTILTMNEPGVYNVKIFTSLQNDQDRSNDTLNSNFTIFDSNSGGGLVQNGGYYFSNSTICADNALSQPKFCWKDTTGSRSLILGGSDVSGGLMAGNIDNGYFCLGNILPQGYKIKFYEVMYDSFFISTNGIIGFKKNNILIGHDPSRLDSVLLQSSPVCMALWMDFDFGNNNVSNKRLSYKVIGKQIIITYNRAPLKGGDSTDYVSFQVSFEIGDSLIQNSKILSQYNFQNTGEGFIEKYYNNTMLPHLIGLKNIDGSKSLTYRYKDSINIVVSGPLFSSSMALEFGSDANKLNNQCAEFTVKVLLEAVSPKRDTVTILIRDADAPYNIIETSKFFLDTNGLGTRNFSLINDMWSYYIVVKHRNSIETWSRDSGEVFNSYMLNYNFSLDSSMAFGNNLKRINGKSYVYTGDVTQDGIVDAGDLSSIDNAVTNVTLENVNADLNNDGIADASDLSLADNNAFIGVFVERP